MRALAFVAALSATAVLAGCGGSPDPIAVRVGDISIGSGAVGHWAKTISRGSAVGGSVAGLHGVGRERALDFLIAANWLIGEAADRGFVLSKGAVEHRLQEKIDSVPGGKSEFDEEVFSTGQTIADVELEIRAEAAAAMLRETVSRRVHPVTQADVVSYYRRNRSRYRVPDVRSTDLIEALHGTRAEAIALGRRIGSGAHFAKMALHERVARETPREESSRGNGNLVRTIFAAAPGAVAAPTRFNNAWVLVVVRKVIPHHIDPLATVRQGIVARVAGERRRLTLFRFVEAYRRKWQSKTDCSPGFVVQKCSQYRGQPAQEGNPLIGG